MGRGGRMIAVAIAVIAGVVAVTCGIVADSNHADTLSFLGVMVKTTAAQIFLAGAICTWALFAAMWLLSVGIRRSKERGLELRALHATGAGAEVGAGTEVGAGAEVEAGAGAAVGADVDPGGGVAQEESGRVKATTGRGVATEEGEGATTTSGRG